MKKILTLMLFMTAFTAASWAYNNQVTLHAYYYQDYEEQWVYNMNASSVYYRLHAEGNSGLQNPAYTHAGIRLVTSLNWYHVKLNWVYNGTNTYTRAIAAPAGQTIVKAKLQASGEGRWENNMKITFNSWVEVNW